MLISGPRGQMEILCGLWVLQLQLYGLNLSGDLDNSEPIYVSVRSVGCSFAGIRSQVWPVEIFGWP